MEAIPGAYPLDPATPTPDVHPRSEPLYEQPQQSHDHHHQRNKLHKPNDPRGHNYTDSGVGMTEPDPVPSFQPEAPRHTDYKEAIGGGTYARDNATVPNTQPTGDRTSTPPHDVDTVYTRHSFTNDPTLAPPETSVAANNDNVVDTNKELNAATGVNASTAAGSVPNADRGDVTPPYWGNLPKAATGGIYNTVTGHGSKTDDHAEHHHLPQRGGIHNTIAGHGSEDEESQRHASSRGQASQDVDSTTDTMFAAPLPGIAEERKAEAAATRKSNTADNLTPETSTRHHAMLARSSEGNNFSKPFDAPTAASPTSARFAAPSNAASTSPPRAFPLAGTHEDSPGSFSSGAHTKDGSQAKDELHPKDPLLAGAAVVGGGAAASYAAGQPNKLRKQKEVSPVDDRRRSSDVADKKGGGAIGGVLPHRHKDEKDHTAEKKKSHDEGSPKGEKKHHKILGIFHRHKDDKDKEELTTAEPTHDQKAHHSDRKKEEAAAAAAAGAGTYGLMHHHKSDKEARDHRSSSEPMNKRDDEQRHSKRLSANENAAATAAESAGGFGMLYQKPEEKTAGNPELGRTLHHHTKKSVGDVSHDTTRDQSRRTTAGDTTERRRSRGLSGSQSAAAAVAESAGGFGVLYQKPDKKHAAEQPLEPRYSNTAMSGSKRRSVTPPESDISHRQASADRSHATSVAAGTAMAAGLGAYHLSGSREPSPRSGAHEQTDLQDTTVFENPREPPRAPSDASHPTSPRHHSSVTPETGHSDAGNYNTLATGTPSGVKTSGARQSHDGTTRHSATNESGNYNTLATGTPSGVKSAAARQSHDGTTRRETDSDGDSQPYNVLASGTPSGVKVTPKHSRNTSLDHSRRSYAQDGDGQYNSIGSSSTSGISHDQQRQAANTEREAARHTLVAAPMPSGGKENKQEVARQNQSGLTMFPTPNQAEHMSPEVMPSSYTASAPRSTSKSRAHDNAPAVPTKDVHHPSRVYESENMFSAGRGPALAAATEAWGSKAGPSSGAGGQSRVVHKCQQCGADNDISSYFH